MIRTFAWCGTYTSTSSTVEPHSSSTFCAELTSTRVANLKTSRPFIFTSLSASSKWREPLPGSQRFSPPPPSAPSSKPRKPPSSTGSTTTAPAPSPKSTSVERSVQSRIFESTSPPTTSARFESPAATIPYACATAYMKPVQPASRS